jgi:mono/diheme cytochrome c family protein
LTTMKFIYLILFCFFSFLLLHQCTSEKKTVYVIPDHVTPRNRQLLTEKAEKGRVLYKLHCSECHGIFTKGKDGVPNFTQTQVDNYHAAALMGIDPRNHAVAKKMSAEQVDQVITFLSLRKRD